MMSGFHAGGFDAAKEALAKEYAQATRVVKEKLRRANAEHTFEREDLQRELASLKKAHEEAIATLQWCDF